MIKDNLAQIKENINDDTTLVCVTKYRSVEELKELYSLGEREFGENKVKELKTKIPMLADDINWHFIGHLQTNKAKDVVGNVVLIHSIDSIRLLETVNQVASSKGIIQDVLLEVNISAEENKYGFDEASLQEALRMVPKLENINVVGNMCMNVNTDNVEVISSNFKKMQNIYNKDLKKHRKCDNINYRVLSMGMSNDYQLAIKNGANMVRVGSAIFR